jgi:pyruvate dehydrogenase E1 component alpha subunit
VRTNSELELLRGRGVDCRVAAAPFGHAADGHVAAAPFGHAADGHVAAAPFGHAADDATRAGPRQELLVALYEHMVLARSIDDRLVALQRDGVIAHYTSARGEEAAILGAVAAMGDDDWVFPSSREAVAALWRGMPLAAYAHHALHTAESAAGGKSGLEPPFWKAARVASVSSLVGTQIPHAVGLAWAARARGDDVAVLVFFGEGATSTGDFHSGLNLAGVTRAPVVAVCRNNGWAMSTPVSRQTTSAGFAVKSVAYGLHGVQVDGADVMAVLLAVRAARERATAGRGGTLVEAVSSADRDPILFMRQSLEASGLWSAERERHLATEVRADVDRAVAEATASAQAPRDTLFHGVYAALPWHLQEQRRT